MDYFPVPDDPYKHEYISFDVDWKDEEFKKVLRKTIAPKNPLNLLPLPKDKISIGMHLRLGGSFENDRVNRVVIPLKLPPVSFFTASLQKIINIFGESQKYYVFIFTDEEDTKYYLDYFRKKFPQENITFDCRLSGNRHDENVLEDFFSMVTFFLLPNSSTIKLLNYCGKNCRLSC